MASIRTETLIDSHPDDVWSALRDWSAIHKRLAPGFVTACRLDGDDRLVTFFNGTVLRERLVDLDDQAQRLVWSIVDGPYTHHNGSAQVFADGDDRARFVWIADLLPNDHAARTRQLMQHGATVIKETLDSVAASA